VLRRSIWSAVNIKRAGELIEDSAAGRTVKPLTRPG
jgi:hypothetical protein